MQSGSSNHGSRFNIIAGSSFNISCDVQRPTDLGSGLNGSDADFYIDTLTNPITNQTLADITIIKITNITTNTINLVLTFNNFQAVHNGRYICQANTTNGTESTRIGHAQYGTGEQCHCVCT